MAMDLVKVKTKYEALGTYLFAYASFCDAVHLDQLMSKFDLKPQTTHSLVCKLWRRPRWAR